jgi:hypothetical protein
MLIEKPGLFDIDDYSHTFQSYHVQNLSYKRYNERF